MHDMICIFRGSSVLQCYIDQSAGRFRYWAFALLPGLELPCRSTHPFSHEPSIIRLYASLHIRLAGIPPAR